MKAQAGICAEPNLHALYLMFNRTGDAAELVGRLAKLPALWQAVLPISPRPVSAVWSPSAPTPGMVSTLPPSAPVPQLYGAIRQRSGGPQHPV